MKKLIATFAILLVASAQADFMKWTVENSDYSSAGIKETVAYVRIGYVEEQGEEPCWDGHTITAYDMDGGKNDGTDIAYVDGAEFQVDFSEISGYSEYAYYIELLNSSGQVIGRSGDEKTHTYTTYADLSKKGYVATGDIGTVPAAAVWHGSFGAVVPEPSSMALLALGAGLVGLRRKLKKGKKGKRA